MVDGDFGFNISLLYLSLFLGFLVEFHPRIEERNLGWLAGAEFYFSPDKIFLGSRAPR